MTHRNFRQPLLFAAAAVSLAAVAIPSNAPAAPRAPETLQNLGDSRLMEELANRGLDSLLDRMFDAQHVPEEQRQGIRTLHALNDLSDPRIKLSNAEKQRKIKQIVAGINTALPNLKDPDSLMRYAGTLLEFGVTHDVNTLEYWGDDPVLQAQLKPVARTVSDLLEKASTEAANQANILAGKLAGNNQAIANQWQKMDDLSNTAKYKEEMVAYFQALATDGSTDAGKQERAKIADDALTPLAEFDNADSGVQPTVRLMMSKLNMVKGDFKAAKASFQSLIDNPGAAIKPAPDIFQQYDSRYFLLVTEMESGDIDAAHAGVPGLITWQQANLPKDKATQDGLSAATDMLRYRIAGTEAELAKNPADKKKANDEAVTILNQLLKDHKEFQTIIFQQLINRIPPTDPVAKLDPLILQGLTNRARAESDKPDGQKFDAAVVQRGLDAAKELISRKDVIKSDPALEENASLLIAEFEEKLGKTVEAAQGYINYAQKAAATNLPQAKESIDHAGYLTFELKKRKIEPVGLSDLYDRFLQVAINPPFDHKALGYLYAKRLQAQDKPVEAAGYFRLVPNTDKNYLNAQYFLLICLNDGLDKKLDPAQRKQFIAEIGTVGANVKQLAASATDPRDRFKAAHATLIAADLAINEQKDPKRALSLLGEFEQQIKGLPPEQEQQLLNKGLFVRVNSYMALNQLSEATGALKALLDKTPGGAGIGMVRDLLDQLDKQYVKADLINDKAAMSSVAKNEAELTGYLVDWSSKAKDPKIRDFAYQYRVYDARTKRLAATLEDDADARKKDLQKVLELYRDLSSATNVALYKKTLDPAKVKEGKINPEDPDVAVEVGEAFTEFDLGQYDEAGNKLGDLLGNHKLGSPQIEIVENGENKIKDNDLYWEAMYKFTKASAEICKNEPAKLEQHQAERETNPDPRRNSRALAGRVRITAIGTGPRLSPRETRSGSHHDPTRRAGNASDGGEQIKSAGTQSETFPAHRRSGRVIRRESKTSLCFLFVYIAALLAGRVARYDSRLRLNSRDPVSRAQTPSARR